YAEDEAPSEDVPVDSAHGSPVHSVDTELVSRDGNFDLSLERPAAAKVRPRGATTCARESWMLIGSEKSRTATPGADESRWPGRGCEEMRVEWAEAACGISASTAAASTNARPMPRAGRREAIAIPRPRPPTGLTPHRPCVADRLPGRVSRTDREL